jgi:cell wall-associated NlpC family hydrolase
MRTLTRRGLLAGAMTVLASHIGGAPVFADEDTREGSVRVRAVPSSLTGSDDTMLSVAPRTSEEQTAADTQLDLGQAIVGFALSYVGYPYVAGGNSPYGFDCSGFTQFVFLNMLGIDIGHGVEYQPSAGYWVDWGNWMPGDLIVFQNTYKAGVSHVGIYIGDAQFVHAENPATGVTISSIYSDYYLAHYWGAVRLI